MTTNFKYSMGAEFDELDAETQAIVIRVIEEARTKGTWDEKFRTGDIYAYLHPGGGIAWGVNGGEKGFNIARGVCKPKTS